jgi:hypothetical protein
LAWNPPEKGLKCIDSYEIKYKQCNTRKAEKWIPVVTETSRGTITVPDLKCGYQTTTTYCYWNKKYLPKVHFLVFALKFDVALLSKSGSLNTAGFPFLIFFASS